MEATKRIIVNTSAQYIRSIINTLLSLVSMRLILGALGMADYGIFSVVGGVVAMLGFITNALIITTQRYISYYHGQGETGYVSKLFTNSLFLHISFAFFIGLGLLLVEDFLMNHVLNIHSGRLDAARQVYTITIGILFITIVTAPLKALFIAHENIVYISIVEICDAVLKLLAAFGLVYIGYDKLLFYALILALIQTGNLMAYAIYAKFHFPECRLTISRKDIDRQSLSQLIGFAGWTTYGMGAIAARNQGTALILNHFFGTVINAAYGVAFQVYGAIAFVGASVLNAMNPQIMKAEGSNDRQHVWRLAEQESKYSAALMAIVSIPVIIEMPSILHVWLKEVPPHTAMFCRFILLSFIIDQLTIGLNTVNQAIGKIRSYSLLMFTPKLLNLPISWLVLKAGHSVETIMWIFIGIEFFVAALRLPYMRATADLNIRHYIMHVIVPLLPLGVVMCIAGALCIKLTDVPFRFILSFIVSATAGATTAWFLTLSRNEREYVLHLFKSKFRK
jgi:O-antigen/teichoic acid export membrane protein